MTKAPETLDQLFTARKPKMTKVKIAATMHACYRNAKELYEEAQMLLEHGRAARGFGLCVLSLEELAKIPLLANAIYLKRGNNIAWSKFWKAFSSHRLKQNTWSVYGKRMFAGTCRERFYKHSWSAKLPALEKMKQLSFYVDFVGTHPMQPNILYGHLKALCDLAVKMAEDRLEAFRPLHSTSARSKNVVAMLSHIKITGASKAEWQEMFVRSVAELTDL